MLDYAQEAAEMVRGRDRGDLDTDRMFVLATLKLVETIGEAARRVSDATRRKHPEIPWEPIIGTRDRLVHGYDRINFDTLWRILQDELPPLIAQLQAILG